ncbi:lipoyl(octanoyl) transferase LipB [Sphingosinicella sp. LHD-64]|uniref:lipoyl(octanoyl) transferase LipB n=1 Tax=Sphingosinicella sp. LHD-64 TaxID=3072139 RepID=UPI00280ED9AB|nr:lipoyl(octanoyl) transferase LipB [Sphingosinicella sp. LHD-64]MDQ8755474.1 lipoyl(octanoyl) transferase LipB [Sphingosinicella sp. LHD-64]
MDGATHPEQESAARDPVRKTALDAIEWRESAGLTPYPGTLAEMEARAAAIREGEARELVWLLEHPPLYTAGTSADPAELTNPRGFPVYAAGRGGRYTYHGPGQRVAYVLLDLNRRGRDIRRYVHALEGWVIDALGDLGITAHRAPGRIGIWVDRNGTEAKVGAIGVRVKRWVTFHGLAVNVVPDLSHFTGIVPCGIAEFPVTSLAELGAENPGPRLDAALKARFSAFLAAVEGESAKA